MSTDLQVYLNYISTWETESDKNIDKLLEEHRLFENLGDYDSDPAVDSEFQTLTGLAISVRNQTIAADAVQVAADAAAVAAIWSFGLSMAAFVALETSEAVEKALISKKSTELNKKLKTVDTDISAKINPTVEDYVKKYKKNNDLIASKAPIGLDTKECRSLLMQFVAQVQKREGKLDATTFRKYAHSARILHDSKEIEDVYKALDTLNLSAKSGADVKEYAEFVQGLKYSSETLALLRCVSVAIMAYKLNIANKTIAENAKAAGFEVSEVEASTFAMLDAVGIFVTGVAVIMSVVDIVLELLDIIDVVKQINKMCDKLDGPIKERYRTYYTNIKTASQQYTAAIHKPKM